ncbi:MAG: PASTA domain-containing protein, partial [Puniceicoccaceae bacterium]
YLLIEGPVEFANITHAGPFMAAFLADGRRAYFENDNGLRLHVVEDFPDWPLPLLEWGGLDHGHPVLTFHGAPGLPYTLQTSSDLSTWQTEEVLHEPVYWTDTESLGTTPRFFRALVEDPRPAQAASPSPANHAHNTLLTPLLSWTAGTGATSHDVYFGTDRPGAFMGNQSGTTFNPGPLRPNTTYYWRVDQRSGNVVTEGEVWRFSTPARPSGVTYAGAGAPAASTGPVTLPLPEGLLPGDTLITFLQTSGPHIYLEDTAGGRWLALARRLWPEPAGSGDNKVHLTAYYSRYDGIQGAPTTNDSGDHQLGVILAFRGVVNNGVPWDAVDSNTRDDLSTSGFIPGATTSVPNTLVVGAMATALPDANGSNNFSGWSPRIAGMTNLTERVDVSTSAGNGGALGIATADFAPAGVSYGRINVDLAVPSPRAMLSAALRPEVAPGLIEDAWPENGAAKVGITARLRWTPSPNAATREVYFGTTSPGAYQGSQTGTTFDPGTLQPNTTYYWRVDEKNSAGTTIGVIRSFSTGPTGALPQLVGMTADNAATELAMAGALVGTLTRVFSDTVAPGVIIGQNPPTGTLVMPGMVVDLVRSRGPEAGVVVFPNGPDFLEGRAIPTHRNVSLVTSKAGTLLAFTGHRPNGPPDEDGMQVHLRRSTDGGETWGPVIIVAEDGMHRCATQVATVLPTGRILLLWLWNEWIPSDDDRETRRVYVTHSDDDGVTWSAHREITSQVYLPGWTWYGLGPGNAFVKQRPPNAGRIIIPARHGRRGASGRPHIIYSDDGGETFQLGGTLDQGSESTAAELSDGGILLNVRLGRIDHRYAGVSNDGGLSFPIQYTDFSLPGAGACQASLLLHSFNPATGQNNILFSNPDDLDERINGTIKLSELDGAPGTWTHKFRYSAPAPAFSGYSDITVMNEAGDIGIVWEFGSHYSKPERWDGGVKFRAIRFDQIDEPIP